MASDVNTVTVSGNLTRDAEVRYTNSGMGIIGFSLATNHSRKNGDKWEDVAHFFDITVFGREKLAPYLTKGKKVFISGRLEQQRWEKDGQKRSAVKIIAEQIVLAGEKGGDSKPKPQQAPGRSDYDDSGLSDDSFDDDLPF